jgi:hypothetical protein
MQLQDIHPATSLQSLGPDLVVTVVAVVPLGPESATLYYKLPDGSLRERLVVHRESVWVASVERPWAFGQWRLWRGGRPRARPSFGGVDEAGVIESGLDKVRLLKWAEYPTDGNDKRLPVWTALPSAPSATKSSPSSAVAPKRSASSPTASTPSASAAAPEMHVPTANWSPPGLRSKPWAGGGPQIGLFEGDS